MTDDRNTNSKSPGWQSVEPRQAASFSDDGVDLTLIRWMLRLTPAERLRVLQQTLRSIATLRDARRKP